MANIELTTNTAISDRDIRKALGIPDSSTERKYIHFGDWLPTLISLDGKGYKNAIDISRGPRVYYYQGKYRRTYFIWLADSSDDMKGFIFYYDHTTGLISDHYQATEPISGATDQHAAPGIIVSNDGYIITCCEELASTSTHNSQLNIYVSGNPEDPGSIDPSTPTVVLGTGGTDDSYSYPHFAKLANNRILLVARQGEAGNDHYRKAMWYSDDNGATWNTVNSGESDGDFLTLGDHDAGSDGLWAYGYFHDTAGDYLALLVDELDHEDPDTIYTNHYLLFTKDAETWGNIEWINNLEGSWSIDATSNVITRPQLIDNCLAVGLGDYTIGDPSKFISIRDIGIDYFTRPYFVFREVVDTVETYYFRYFDIANNQWIQHDISTAISETVSKHIQMKPLDEKGEIVDVFMGVQKTNIELNHYRTKDKGQTMALIEEVTGNSGKDHTYPEINFNNMKEDVYCIAVNYSDGVNADLKIFIGDNEVSQADVRFLKDQTINSGSIGDLVSFDGTNWDQADADTESLTSGMLGMIIGYKTVLIKGVFHTTGLSAGDTYYVSPTAGGITNTKPSATGQFVRAIGYAYNSKNLIFDPDKTYIEIS